RKPMTSMPHASAAFPTPRMAAFRPGLSPPAVMMPMRLAMLRIVRLWPVRVENLFRRAEKRVSGSTFDKRALGTPIPTARSPACDAFFVLRQRPAPTVFATNRPEPDQGLSRPENVAGLGL